MKVTFPEKKYDVAELMIDGASVFYRLPPETGTHQEVFQALSKDKKLRVAQGREVAAYAHGCLLGKNEWTDRERVKFPTKNYLRFPNITTTIPMNREQFGDLEGGLLVDLDIIGEGITSEIYVPKDLSDWTQTEVGILAKGSRKFVPHSSWYNDQWDENNGALIALVGVDGAELLARTAKDSGRINKPLWKVDVNDIKTPERRVPVLGGDGRSRLGLSCDDRGYGDGCGVGVLK